eukprot:SAG31_NODE_969_length_10677_cov_7.080072_3_plen_153_part_00
MATCSSFICFTFICAPEFSWTILLREIKRNTARTSHSHCAGAAIRATLTSSASERSDVSSVNTRRNLGKISSVKLQAVVATRGQDTQSAHLILVDEPCLNLLGWHRGFARNAVRLSGTASAPGDVHGDLRSNNGDLDVLYCVHQLLHPLRLT